MFDDRFGQFGETMKSHAVLGFIVSCCLVACDKGSHKKDEEQGPLPAIVPPVEPLLAFEKADHFVWPQNVSWITQEGDQPPAFSAEDFCGSKDTTCLNSYLNKGQVLLETAVPFSTQEAVAFDLRVQFSGWARKFGVDESSFKWHSFFKVRVVFQTKDANGNSRDGSQIAVLLARDIEDPQITPWQGEEKAFLYTSGNASDQFQMTGKLPRGAENIKVRIYDVGATQLQVQKIEIRMNPAS